MSALVTAWRALPIARWARRRRFDRLDALLGGQLSRPQGPRRLLDVGCARGQDVLAYCAGTPGLDAHGLDLHTPPDGLPGATFHQGDAAALPFPDGHFDVVVSVGALEHIQPLEKLSQVLSEIRRVSRIHALVVPAIHTPMEPHMGRPLWQLRGGRRKPHPDYPLLYLSDEAWLAFEALQGDRALRFAYVPGVLHQLILTNAPG